MMWVSNIECVLALPSSHLFCRRFMTHEDFDVDSLAVYLHLTPQQVEKLTSRGKIPGRRVAGDWRFARAEIHHWLEERIGLLDDDELDQVEGMLDRSNTKAVDVSALIPPGGVAIPLAARTKGSAIKAMVELGADTGLLWDPGKMEIAVRAREEMQSTALDIGVALLHPRRPLPNILAEAFVAFGRTGNGIPFGGSRTLTDLFFLICSTSDRNHLRILARISRLISIPEAVAALRLADNEAELRAAVQQWEK